MARRLDRLHIYDQRCVPPLWDCACSDSPRLSISAISNPSRSRRAGLRPLQCGQTISPTISPPRDFGRFRYGCRIIPYACVDQIFGHAPNGLPIQIGHQPLSEADIIDADLVFGDELFGGAAHICQPFIADRRPHSAPKALRCACRTPPIVGTPTLPRGEQIIARNAQPRSHGATNLDECRDRRSECFQFPDHILCAGRWNKVPSVPKPKKTARFQFRMPGSSVISRLPSPRSSFPYKELVMASTKNRDARALHASERRGSSLYMMTKRTPSRPVHAARNIRATVIASSLEIDSSRLAIAG